MPYYFIFPFLSSLLYVVAALFIKRANSFDICIWRIAFVTNLITAIIFCVIIPMGGEAVVVGQLWQPLVVAALFVGGQVLTFVALEKGDVSVATPAFGAKTVVVAWLSTAILGVELPWQLWAGAVLSFLAIALLNAKPGGGKHRAVGLTIVFSLLAATCYAAFDVLVQKWAPAWGTGWFLPVMFWMSAALSGTFIPLFKAPLRALPWGAWKPLLGGGTFMGLQALFLVSAIAKFGDATAINVIYSARGLWSVIAVWTIGHWFGNTERHQGGGVFSFRLAGAALMTGAIVVTLLR